MKAARPIRAFYGQYRHSIDEKGRLSIPADFRPILLGERGSFFLNRGFEWCIMGYPEEKWQRVLGLVNAVALDDTNTRWFKRMFFSHAKEVSCDRQGRILIPQPLTEYAGITKEVVIVGVSDFVEIWDAATWDQSLQKTMDAYGKMAEKVIQSAAPGREDREKMTKGE